MQLHKRLMRTNLEKPNRVRIFTHNKNENKLKKTK